MSKIKKFLLFSMFSVFIFACLGVAACKEQLSDETKAEIETAYFSYAYSYDDSIYETQFEKYGGTYSGNIVAMMSCRSNNLVVSETVIEYYVDDVFVCYLPNGSYSFIVYTQSKEITDFQSAYNDGIITKNNLMSIRNALK